MGDVSASTIQQDLTVSSVLPCIMTSLGKQQMVKLGNLICAKVSKMVHYEPLLQVSVKKMEKIQHYFTGKMMDIVTGMGSDDHCWT